MNEFDVQESLHIKEQHSEVFTLRSIGSSEEILQLVPLYNQGGPVEQFKSGHWSAKEHIKYIMFIDYFSDIFSIKHNRKLWKIFTIMSAFIKTRNSSQCRSHHQKNERKHKSIQEILELLRNKYKNYATQFEKMKKVLRKLPIHNPIEVDNQKSTMALLPSIKVLQENLEYQVYKNPISMKNIQISKKDLKQIKNRNSEKNIKITKEKYIGSEVSIQMEDQSQEGYNDRVKSLYVNQNEPVQKNARNYGSSGIDSSYKKDQKLDKTADSYLDEGVKNLIKTNLQPNLNPVMQSVNSDITSQSFAENVRNYINIVQMKKTRSSLPCFDEFSFDEEALKLGQRLRNSKKQAGNTEGKCKTLPPRSVKIENSDDSWLSDKNKDQQKSVRKSLFSGFISSFEESNRAFEENSKFFNQNYQSFDKFAVEYQFDSEKVKKMDFRRLQNASERDYIEPKINLLFCEDQYQNNLRKEISLGQSLMCSADKNMLKFKEAPQKQQFLQNMQAKQRNFIKKRSREPETIQQQKKQEIQKSEDLQLIRRQSSLEISQSDQQHNTHSQLFFSNSDQMTNKMQNLYQNPYLYGYNPTINFPPIYNHYWYVPQQYPMVEYNMYKFIEFFLYFLIHKLVANNFYLPFE